jgi:hypothetical protein
MTAVAAAAGALLLRGPSDKEDEEKNPKKLQIKS